MKRLFTLFAIALISQAVMAGGILTNSNQSAQFVRMLSRNASLQIDGVYYNPAGLMNLENGWHFSLNNQSIFQTKTVDSKFPWLNDGYYEGDVKAPVFPSAFAVYKMDKLAFSIGFGPNGGGGSATFERGLPSFEIPLTKLIPGLAGLKQLPSPLNYNVSGYDAKLYFDGSSIFWGIQAGASYKVNDMFSVYGGVRYLPSTNTYSGSIQNIQLKVNSSLQNAKTFLTTAAGQISTLATQASAGATQLSGAASSAQQLITLGAGTLTIAQVQAAGYISAAQRASFEGALASIGLTSAQIAALNVTQVQGAFSTAAATYAGQATQLNATSAKLSGISTTMGDKKVETEQTGAGWTPILGANINLNDKLNIGIKYEFQTKLVLTNSTSVDDLGLFPDGGTSNSDLPAILAVGIGYKPSKLIEAQLSYNLYFDKNVNWGKNVRDLAIWKSVDASKIRERNIDKNYWELALGLQFNITDKFAFSLGGMRSQPGVGDSYQSDFSYTNPSTTGALGIQWKVTDKLTLDLGAMNTFYKDETVKFNDPDLKAAGVNGGDYNEILGKKTMGFAVGLSYSIF